MRPEEVEGAAPLLIILRLLIIVGLLFITIVAIIVATGGRSTGEAHTKSC
jgi:hypothetical protein